MFEAQTHTQLFKSATVVDQLLNEKVILSKLMFYISLIIANY